MASAATTHEHHDHDHGHGHDDHHHVLPWWEQYLFSQDHKVIGIQYAVTGLAFLFFGFCLMMVMRWNLAYPNTHIPVIGGWLQWFFNNHGNNVFGLDKDGVAGALTAEGYNTFGA